MKNITQITKEFADTLLKTPEFVELQEATKQFERSKEAQTILNDLQDRKQTVITLQQTGLPVSDKQQQELEAAFSKMRKNAVCMRMIKAQNTAIQLARAVSNQLTESTSVPFASGGGCCG